MAKKRKAGLRGDSLRNLLNRPVVVAGNEGGPRLHPWQAAILNDLAKALRGDMAAAKRVIKECLKYGILEPVSDEEYWPGSLSIPEQWDEDLWYKKLGQHGFPPWPGAHDGFSDEDRERYNYWKKHGRYQ